MTLRRKITAVASIVVLSLSLCFLAVGYLAQKSYEARLSEAVATEHLRGWQQALDVEFAQMEDNRSALELSYEVRSGLKDASRALVEEFAPVAMNLAGGIDVLAGFVVADNAGRVQYKWEKTPDAVVSQDMMTRVRQGNSTVRALKPDGQGGILATIAFPLEMSRQPVGIGIYAKRIDTALGEFKSKEGSEVFIVDEKGNMLAGSAPDLYKPLAGSMSLGTRAALASSKADGMVYQVSAQPLSVAEGSSPLYLVTAGDNSKQYMALNAMKLAVVASTMAISAAALVLLYYFLKSALSPLAEASRIAMSVSKGDLDVQIEARAQDMDNEVGQLMQSLRAMVDNLRQIIGNVTRASSIIENDSQGLKKSSAHMSEVLTEYTQKTSAISSQSTEMTKALEDIARNLSQISNSAHSASGIATQGAADVGTTFQAVSHIASDIEEVAAVVKSLDSRVRQIESIVSVIDDIADQTNLLALNAAIEAARAGDQGRGFAVVADEVRKLASKTTSATTEIDAMISAVQEESQRAASYIERSVAKAAQGVALSLKAGESLEVIVKDVRGLEANILNISAAADQITASAELIRSDIVHVEAISRQSAQDQIETLEMSESLLVLSMQMGQAVAAFKSASNGQFSEVEGEEYRPAKSAEGVFYPYSPSVLART